MFVLIMRCHIIQEFRNFFLNKNFVEITPPTLLNNPSKIKGELTSFKLKSEDGYLSQSSQMHLESVIPLVGNCFSITSSFQKSKQYRNTDCFKT